MLVISEEIPNLKSVQVNADSLDFIFLTYFLSHTSCASAVNTVAMYIFKSTILILFNILIQCETTLSICTMSCDASLLQT